jgi:hypothetical protein
VLSVKGNQPRLRRQGRDDPGEAGDVAALDVGAGRCSGTVPGKDGPQVPLTEGDVMK